MSSPTIFFPSPNTAQNQAIKAFFFDGQSLKENNSERNSPFLSTESGAQRFFPASPFKVDNTGLLVVGNYEKNQEVALVDEETHSTLGSHDSKESFKEIKLECSDSSESRLLKRKGKWSEEDDSSIINLFSIFGKKWNKIAQHFDRSRNAKQIRERYINHLDPEIIKTPFTTEEEAFIIRTFTQIGPKWTKISSMMPGRTENQIKNKFHLKLKNLLPSFSSSCESENEASLQAYKMSQKGKRKLPFEFTSTEPGGRKKIRVSLESPSQWSDGNNGIRVKGLDFMGKEELLFLQKSLHNCLSLLDSQLSSL